MSHTPAMFKERKRVAGRLLREHQGAGKPVEWSGWRKRPDPLSLEPSTDGGEIAMEQRMGGEIVVECAAAAAADGEDLGSMGGWGRPRLRFSAWRRKKATTSRVAVHCGGGGGGWGRRRLLLRPAAADGEDHGSGGGWEDLASVQCAAEAVECTAAAAEWDDDARRSESRVKRVMRRILCAETARGEGEIMRRRWVDGTDYT
uniref:Uncharacterized protein n=1 Tax=Oryza sativa subsp. japonica TaxID=39947 RepID=Q6Z0I3_ORYSJ|nr:hypothetical protein [Oryza sativa Japonica Group]BAD03623.1 hypothetical protein [Oryza sativa Japonica Group]